MGTVTNDFEQAIAEFVRHANLSGLHVLDRRRFHRAVGIAYKTENPPDVDDVRRVLRDALKKELDMIGQPADKFINEWVLWYEACLDLLRDLNATIR